MYFLSPKMMPYKSDGFTLIECIVSIAIFEIIFGVEAVFLMRLMNNFNEMTNQNKNVYYSNEAFTFIKHEIDACLSCSVLENNVIEITMAAQEDKENKKDIITQNYIMMYQNQNLIIRYGSIEGNNFNYISKGVKEFNVKQNGSVIYIKIAYKGGKKYERCFGIKKKMVS